jgi:chromosomal replication initiator protein
LQHKFLSDTLQAMRSWDLFIDRLKARINPQAIDTWLKGFAIVHFDAQNLYMEAVDPFHISWFEEHIRPYLSDLRNDNNRPIKIHLTSPDHATKKNPSLISAKPYFPFFPLDETKTFDAFLAKGGNAIAYELLKQLECRTEKTFLNPTFLWGPSSSGKTHLLNAACLHLKNLGFNVSMVHASLFTDQVVQAIRSSRMQEFRSLYRNLDVLAVDDVHLLTNKTATQEEFFHTFNALHTRGKNLLFSSILPPYDMEGIEPRLISRFEWGISLPLETLHVEDLSRVLENKLYSARTKLLESSKTFLLKTFGSSTSALCHAIDTLFLRAHLTNISMDHLKAETLSEMLKDLLEDDKKVTEDTILNLVAAAFQVTAKEILGKSQTKECALPRQVAMYFLRSELDMPFKKIGEIFSRDHSTVMSSVRVIEMKIKEKSDDIFDLFRDLKNKLSMMQK